MNNENLPVVTLAYVPGTTQWVTAREVDWFGMFTIPMGFEPDLASIPVHFGLFYPCWRMT